MSKGRRRPSSCGRGTLKAKSKGLTEQSLELATLCQRFASSSTTDAGGRSNVQTRIVRPETHGAHFQCRVKRLTGPAWRRHIDCSELATSRKGPTQGA